MPTELDDPTATLGRTMSASKAFAFSLAVLLGAGHASAQSTVIYDGAMDAETEASGSVSGTTAIGSNGGYFWAQGDFGERPGIPGNYASFGAFAPLDFLGPNEQFFLDGQMTINDDTNIGANIGLGYRRLFEDWGSIFGANAFYAYDRSQNGFSYNQASVGGEWLTEYFQLTGNVYVPFDMQANKVGPLILTKNSQFFKDNLVFIDLQHAEGQNRGADVDLAVPVPGAQWLSVAGGAYYYDSKNNDSYNGWRARLQGNFTNVMTNLTFAKDDVYGSQVNFAATYFFGASNGNYNPSTMSLYDRMNTRVRRQARIPVQQTIIEVKELAINPATGLPWTFAHFDNTAAPGGDGTTENRFNALVPNTTADAILIHRGTTTRTNLLPGGTGITLNDNQLVFGEGCPTFIDVLNRPGAPCPLPTWDPAGTNPFVTADAGNNIFTLADNNTITGVNMIAPAGGNAIVGNNITDFTLTKLNRNINPADGVPNGTTGAGGGIVLTNASGTGVIQDFGFNIPSAVGPNGIVISNTNQPDLNVSITDGRFLNGGENGILLSANNSQIVATIDNVNNTGSSTGLRLQASNTGDVLANVTDSHFDNTVGAAPGSGDGISMSGNQGDVALNISNSTAINADRDGLHAVLTNGSSGTINAATLDLSGAGDDAMFTSQSDSQLNLTGTGINASNAGDDGYDFRLTAGSQLNAALTGSNLSNATDDGIVGSLAGGSQAQLVVNTTDISNAGGDGLFVTNSGTSQFLGSLTDSSLDSAGANGVRLDTAGTSRTVVILDNSDATNAGQNGLVSTTVGNSRTDIAMVDQSFDNAGQDAFNVTSNSGSLTLVSGNRVTGANAGDDGIQVTADDGRVGMTWINTGSFAGAADDGINFSGINGSNISLDIDGAPSSFNGAGGDGIQGNLTDSTGLLRLTDVTFQNAGGEGIGITATNSTFTGDITNGSFNNAGSNGARLSLDNSTGNLVLDNTDLFNAGGDALQVTAVNGSGGAVALLNGISLDSAGDDAIDVMATDSTVSVSGSQTSGSFATDDAIHLAADNSQIGLALNNALSFTNPGGDGIDFSGINGSILSVQVSGFPTATFANAGGNGVVGNLTDSTATLGLTNTNFNNATLDGLGVTATNSIFNGTVNNGNFASAGQDAMRLTLDNSTGNLTLSSVNAQTATGNGLIVTGNNTSTSVIGLNNVQLDDSGIDSIRFDANNASSIQGVGTGVTGARAGDDGIDLVADNGSLATLSLSNSGSFSDAADNGATLSANNGSIAGLALSGLGSSLNNAGSNGVIGTANNGSLVSVALANTSINNAGLDALNLNATLNSAAIGSVSSVSLNDAGDEAIDLSATQGSQTQLTGSGVTGSNAADNGILANASTNSRIDVNLTGVGNFSGAGTDGVQFTGTNNSLVNLVLAGAPGSFNGAGANGINGTLTDSSGTLNITNITFANAAVDSLHLDLTNAALGSTITGSDFSRPGPAPSGDDGIDISLDNSASALTITGTAVDNAGDDAVHIDAINGSVFVMKFNGGSLVNAGGDMLENNTAGGSISIVNIDPVATGANQNGVRFNAITGSAQSIIISNSDMSLASDPVGQNGVLGFLDNASTVNLTLDNSDIANATLDGINVVAQGGSTFNGNFINSQVSNAGGDGLDLTLTDSTSNLTFDNSDLNNAGGDAIHVAGTNSTVRMNLSNGIALDNAGGDAMDFTGDNTDFTILGNQNVTATGAGGDALHVNVTNTSNFNAIFAGSLTMDGAGDNAIDLNVNGSTGNVQVRGASSGANATNDAIDMNGLNGSMTVQLFNAGSFANAGGDGVEINADNTTVGLRFRGTTPGSANLNGAGDNGIIAGLTNNSLAQFDLNNFQIQGAGQNGVSFGLNNSLITNSVFTNGQIDNNGSDNVANNQNALKIVAANGSNVGTRATQTPGLLFSNVTMQNDAVNPRPQEHGVNASVDGNSFVGLSILNGNIARNDGDGVLATVNPDGSLSDTSLLVMNFDNTDVSNNWGDGFHITAQNGTDDVTPPQTSGAIVNFANGDINNNGNFINAPATGIIGDGLGDGIDATATGDGSVAGNTQITFNLNNANINGNEEQALQSAMSNGGSVNFNLVGGSVSGALNVPCADGPLAFVQFTLNGTTVSSSSQLILCAKNNGTLIADVGNVDFSNNDGQGIIMLAETGGDITANLHHIDVRNNGNNLATPINPDVNPPISTVDAAIQGLVQDAGSTITLTMDEIIAVNNQQGGLDLSVLNGGLLNATVTDSNFSDNGLSGAFDAIQVNVDGANSSATLNMNNVLADNATLGALNFDATNGGDLNLTMNRISAQNAAGADGFSLVVDNATATLNADAIDVDQATAGNAVNIVATNGSTLDIQNLSNVVGTNAGIDGFHMDILNNSTLTTFNCNTMCMHDATDDGFDINITNGSTTPVLNFTNVAGDRAGDNGFILTATDPTVTLAGVNITKATFQGAGNNGVEIDIANQTTPTSVTLNQVNADDAGNRGVLVDINNVTGGQTIIDMDFVTGNNAGGDDGLEVNVNGLGATDSVAMTLKHASFNNAANEGVDLNFDGAAGSTASLIVNGLSANDAVSNGVSLTPTSGLDLRVNQFNNIVATNAGGDGVQATAFGPSSLSTFLGNTIDVTGAAGDGMRLWNIAPGTGPSTYNLQNLTANDAGLLGVDVMLSNVPGASSVSMSNVQANNAQGGDGVNVTAVMAAGTDSTAITLSSVSATNANEDGVQIDVSGTGDSTISLTNVNGNAAQGGDAVNIDVAMGALGDSTAITLNNIDASNANQDGLNLSIVGDGTPGDTTATIAVDGITANNNTRDGIDFSLDQGVTATVTQFDNVGSTLNQENGMQVDVRNGSVLTQFTASGLDLSNNGTSGVGFDGLDIQVQDAGSSASFALSNLTINNSGGRGIDLDVANGGTLGFDLDTAAIGNSGLGGIDLNVGSLDEFGSPVVAGVPGTFTGTWTDVNVSNSGQSLVFTADGINVDVDGVGSSANLVMNTVTSNNNDADGIDIRVDSGASGTFEINDGTTANANAGVGLRFVGDGAGTTVDLTSDPLGAANVFNNNLGGSGVDILLTNTVTATNLNLAASATGNAADGVRVIANDGTGVTINNFGITGTGLQVNNNANDGLHIDFNAVNGINDFELQNVTVTGNGNDQIFAQFRNMTLDHITLDTVTTTGTATSDDGIEISLIDTQVTPANPTDYAFEVRNVTSTGNGDDGLVLTVTEALRTDLTQTSGLTNGLITGSEFATNGGQGVQLTFQGDSTASFDIIDNTLGFHNNTAEGILIEVQDQAQFDIAGTNLENGAQSMYNNQITNNGGIGFHVVASEPLDVALVVADGSGPRVDLDLGDILRNPNTITGNRDAAMAIEMAGDSTGSFNMVNSILTNTTNGPSANFNGDGLAFRLNNFAELESLTIDGTAAGLNISGNAGSGLVTSVADTARLGTLNRMTVLNTTIQNNGLHGIDIQRSDAGLYGPDPANNQIIIGQFGQGNTIQNNGVNGINIVNNNMPGGPIPLAVDITDNNILTNGNDGIFMRGTGNAQFIGQINDNDVTGNGQDGINFQLENDASLGDPSLASNPAADPFLMAGNQITGSGRHGIFFDTNSTNESGPFSGGAYANVLIQDSLNAVDAFANPVRTLISGNGVDGVHIADNSDFAGNGTTATLLNTYTIRATDIVNNTRDGIQVRVAAEGSIVGANNGVILNLGNIAAPDQRDVVIQGNGDDGLDVLVNTGDSTLNFNNITIQGNGATGDAAGGNGMEIDIAAGGTLDANFENLDVIQNVDDGMDWNISTLAFGNVSTVNMFAVNSSQNGERGLDVRSTHDRILIGAASNTVWNIGRGDRLTAADVNRFNQNGREGIVFDSQATSLSQNTVVVNGTTGVMTDNNPDVFVDVNLPFNVPTFPLRSTNHAIVGDAPAIIGETRIHLIDTVNIINSEIANNGTTFEDGLVLAVGSLTRMNASLAGDSFGGNVGDDIRIYAQRSSELNPPNSLNNNPAAQINGLNQNFHVYDPVAYMDLVFGAVDTDLNGTVDAVLGNGRAATSGPGGTGNGDQITVLTFGTNATVPITRDGVYTNNDPIKGAGATARSVVLAGQVQVNGVFDDETVNDFFQTGVQQIIDNQFIFFNQVGAQPYPDPVLP
jgi:hypothetical protein